MGRASSEQLTLLLSHEINSVLTSMRATTRAWAVVPSYYEEERTEPNKYDEQFRNLKKEIYHYTDWSQVDPMVYLNPFLSLLKATDVGGSLTGTVAVAIQRILSSDLLLPDTVNGANAVNQLAEDARQAKFQTTGNLQEDEVILLNIVNVLALCVECKASVLLTDMTYIKLFQAVFMMADPANQAKLYGEMVGYYSRQVCRMMIRTLFERLRLVADVSPAIATASSTELPDNTPSAQNQAHTHSHFLSQPVSQPVLLPAAAAGLPTSLSQESSGAAPTVPCLHGAKAASEILDLLTELCKRKDDTLMKAQIEETILFVLEMVHTALLSAGPELSKYDTLVAQMHVEVLAAMCEAVVMHPALSIVTAMCQILSCLYSCLGRHSIGQLELIITRVLLKLADGKGVVTIEQQEVALEGLLDLVRTPGFVHDMFVNCDCRLERSNLFEELCGLLSRTAHPSAKGQLSPLNLVSLEALTAILHEIALEVPLPLVPTPTADLELPFFVDIWSPMVKGHHPDLSQLMQQSVVNAAGAAGSTTQLNAASVVSAAELVAADGAATDELDGDTEVLLCLKSAAFEKHLKQKVALAIDHFNKDHKKGFQFLQSLKLMPLLEGSPAAVAALANAGDNTEDVRKGIVDEDQLAKCMGHFLHSCPGLNKVAIGDLLGEPDQFYLKVLDAYTESFDFSNLKFDAAIRMFLESFRLPGEAQKIDRIINSFGKHFYAVNKGIFANSDAAYVLAYSVIMLNTDRHNQQVKKKMELEGFRRNLRGVNDGANFPEEFLDEIFYSIVRTELRMTESTSMDVSEQKLLELHQSCSSPRGQMLHAATGRHLFNGRMFQLLWSPAVSAMCAIIDNVKRQSVLDSAFTGLQLAASVASQHQLEDVADNIVSSLAKIPMQLAHITPVYAAPNAAAGSQRPDVQFGRDPRMMGVTRAMFEIAIKHGDSLTTGWVQLVELLVILYRQGILPDTFTRALDGDGEGGLAVREGEGVSLSVRRLAAARATAAQNRSLLTAWTATILGGAQEPIDPYGPDAAPLSDADMVHLKEAQDAMAKSAFEDIFLDSKFLKQESLVHLVKAVITASGPIPRPTTVGLGTSVSGSLAYTAGGTPISGGWDVSELMLELLFGILLRNRDRIAALWPVVYDHLQAIFKNSKDVDPMLVQKAVMTVMRLCLRLLPYKPHISEPLVKGVQLVALVDEQVAADMATTIATELLSLLKAATPYLKTQQVWMALTGLLKIIQYDPPSFRICVDAVSWVVLEGLNPYNFCLILTALVDLLERAAERVGRGGLVSALSHTNTSHHLLPPPITGRTSSAPAASGNSATAASSVSQSADSATEPLIQGARDDSLSSPQGTGSPSPPPGPVGDPVVAHLLLLLKKSEEWLEVWWVSAPSAGGRSTAPSTASTQPVSAAAAVLNASRSGSLHTSTSLGGAGVLEDPQVVTFQQDAWPHVMSCLCRAIKNPNLQVRLGALDCLQRSVVAAEKFLVPAAVVQRVLIQLLVPITSDMCRTVAQSGPNAKDFPQVDVTVRELVRALAKVVLLYAPLMGNTPPSSNGQPAPPSPAAAMVEPFVVGSTWGPAWRSMLDCLVQGMTHAAPRSELLGEAIPEALKNMVLMLHAKGALREGWRDANDGTDLHEATWRAARKVSANLTPAILQLTPGLDTKPSQ